MEPIRVLLVDDHTLFRKGLASLIEPLEDMAVVGEASDGQEALDKARKLMPDLVLMDIHMPGWHGLKATQLIKEEMPYVKIIMLTVSDEDENIFEAIKQGAAGYLLKDIKPEKLFKLIRGVYKGEAPVSRLAAAKILDEFARLAQETIPAPSSGESLTRREREVLQLVAQGCTNKEIASQLFIAESTVKNHLRNILAKLHLQNRVQAVTYALREGLIDNPSSEG